LHRPEADAADTETAKGITLHAPSLKNLPHAAQGVARQHQAGEASSPAAITGSASEPGPLGPRDLTGRPPFAARRALLAASCLLPVIPGT
jgi:hypothetical protein